MASNFRLSRSAWSSSRNSGRVVFGANAENTLIYPFDHHFFMKYGDFVEKVGNIEGIVYSGDECTGGMIDILTPYTIVDIMLNEEKEDMSLTTSIQDTLYDEYEYDLVNKVLDELYRFYMTSGKPHGFYEILKLAAMNDRFIYLLDFFGVREEDSMIYILCESE